MPLTPNATLKEGQWAVGTDQQFVIWPASALFSMARGDCANMETCQNEDAGFWVSDVEG